MYFAAILLLIVVLPVASVAIEARCFIPAPRRSWRFANLSMGRLGLLSLAIPARVVPAVIMGGLYYGFAGGSGMSCARL